MPELPEIETIRRSLLPHLIGVRIVEVTVRERRLRRPIAAVFEARLRLRRIIRIERRGKYLLFDLEQGRALLVHLGMSGSLELRPAAAASGLHDHVSLILETGAALVLNDARRFSLMRVGRVEDFPELANLGRDPLAAEPSPAEWLALVRGRRLPIKNMLMDQRVIAGIGNIYANEMLYEAGIRPRRRARGLRRAEVQRLAGAMRKVLEDALRLGGSSISDYRDANGRLGFFQMYHAVYDRAGKPCRRCSTAIRRIVLSGRSSFYCPRCQR